MGRLVWIYKRVARGYDYYIIVPFHQRADWKLSPPNEQLKQWTVAIHNPPKMERAETYCLEFGSDEALARQCLFQIDKAVAYRHGG